MMDGNLGTAKLQVNPPALGPIEVRIALQAGHAQVWLSSHSAVTRDALESSAPKLREMLGSQGFAQVSVDISQRSFQERSPPSHAYEARPAISESAAILPASTAVSRTTSRSSCRGIPIAPTSICGSRHPAEKECSTATGRAETASNCSTT